MVAALNMTQFHGITPPSGALGNALGGSMPVNSMGGMSHGVNPDIIKSFLQRNGMNIGHNMGQNP